MAEKNRAYQKAKILEELALNPIVEAACRKAKLPRSTFYLWCTEDEVFEDAVVFAKAKGRDRINDMAESQLIKGIGNGEFRHIKYWLDHNQARYISKRTAKRPFKFLRMKLGINNDEDWE